MKKSKWLASLSLALVLLLALVPSAFASVRTENGGDVPFYARIATGEIYHTEDWAVIFFYRPPECIPADFNLLNFIDAPRAFSCTPATTDGFSIWENGPGIDPAPRQVSLHGLGAVPTWFVSWPVLSAAVADGVLTIGELKALPTLTIGSASFYQETLHPLGANKIALFEANARGTLSDGRTFQVAIVGNTGAGRDTHVKISFS